VANIFIAIMDESYSMSIRQAESEKLKKKQQLAPSRESDLNNDDDLWNAVLGISKPSTTMSATPPSITVDDPSTGNSNGNGNSTSNNGDSDSDGGDNASSGDDRNKKSIAEFMELLDAQHAKLRAETQASLEKFMGNMKSNNNNDSGPSPQPMKESRKISFDLGMKSTSKSARAQQQQGDSTPNAIRRRTVPPTSYSSYPSTATPSPNPPSPPLFPSSPTTTNTTMNPASLLVAATIVESDSDESFADEDNSIQNTDNHNQPHPPDAT